MPRWSRTLEGVVHPRVEADAAVPGPALGRSDLDSAGSGSAGGVEIPSGIDTHSVSAMFDERLARAHGVIGENFIPLGSPAAGSDVKIFFVGRERDAIGICSGSIFVTAQQCDFPIFNKIKPAERQFPGRIF